MKAAQKAEEAAKKKIMADIWFQKFKRYEYLFATAFSKWKKEKMSPEDVSRFFEQKGVAGSEVNRIAARFYTYRMSLAH